MKHDRQLPQQIVLRVSEPLRLEIETAAAQEGRSLANMARRILEKWVADHHQGAAA
jgi:predicted HicB family RNase H-like nuclease